MLGSTAKVLLSTASVFPEPAVEALEIASGLGYDGVELHLAGVPDLDPFRDAPVLAVHASCLVDDPTDPWTRLAQARSAAELLGAEVVVVHPPLRWRHDYAKGFVESLRRMSEETAVSFAVENMFPLRSRARQVNPYGLDWDPTGEDLDAFTLDVSHASVSRADPLAVRRAMGDRLRHVHLADGTGATRDEHLVPGRGTQPCAQLLEDLAVEGYDGCVVVEVSTRRCEDRYEREADLAEALAFTRLNLAAPA